MPEPASIALLGMGSVGLAVRFARVQYHRAKDVLDRVAGAMLMIVSAPVMAFCAAAVKLTSRGPALYRQARVGLNGREFMLYKLRTMYQDAEAHSGPVWACGKADPRVTPVGRLLRRTHLDELPQLFNVIKGEMSLIGPRPERPHFVAQFREEIPEYDKRLSVKPGITGLAQVRAGYDRTLRDVRRKVKLDLMYIRRMCWWVDFLIFFGTFGRIFRGGTERRGGPETNNLTDEVTDERASADSAFRRIERREA